MSLLKKIGLSKEPEKKVTSFKKEAQKFAENMLADGETTIMWDGELAEGTEIFVDVEGVLTPIENGTYALGGDMEGTSIEVEDGMVSAIDTGEGEEEDMAKESEVAEALSAIKKDYESKIEDLESKFNKSIEAKDKEIETLKTDFEKFKKSSPAKPAKNKFKKEQKKFEGKESGKSAILDMVRNKN